MAMIAVDVHPLFAALMPDGSVLLELAIGDTDQLVKVTMPPSKESTMRAADVLTTLDLDDLTTVAPELSREIDEFMIAIRQRLIERATQE